MLCLLVTLDNCMFEISLLMVYAFPNMRFMLVTLDTSHFERSPLNEVAPANIALIVVTLDTSHFEISPLKELASSNILSMSVTLDTSHSTIDPCGAAAKWIFRREGTNESWSRSSCDREARGRHHTPQRSGNEGTGSTTARVGALAVASMAP